MTAHPHKSALRISPAIGEGFFVAWRSGSRVASRDCEFGKSISALTYSISFGFWVSITCCQGNWQAPTLLGMLPPESSRMGGQEGGEVTLEESVSWAEEVRKAGASLNPHSQSSCPEAP